MSVTIRYADVGDAEAIAAVHTASLCRLPIAPCFLVGSRISSSTPRKRRRRIPGWRRCLERPRISTTVVACDDLAVVGFSTLRSAPSARAGRAAGRQTRADDRGRLS